jgi:hypothetical protein
MPDGHSSPAWIGTPRPRPPCRPKPPGGPAGGAGCWADGAVATIVPSATAKRGRSTRSWRVSMRMWFPNTVMPNHPLLGWRGGPHFRGQSPRGSEPDGVRAGAGQSPGAEPARGQSLSRGAQGNKELSYRRIAYRRETESVVGLVTALPEDTDHRCRAAAVRRGRDRRARSRRCASSNRRAAPPVQAGGTTRAFPDSSREYAPPARRGGARRVRHRACDGAVQVSRV